MANEISNKNKFEETFFELVLSILLGVSLAEFLSLAVNNIAPLVSWAFFSLIIVVFYLCIVYFLLMSNSTLQENKIAYLTKIILIILLIMLPYVFVRSVTTLAVDKLETLYVLIYIILLPLIFVIWRYLERKTWKDWSFGLGILLLLVMIAFAILNLWGL